MPGPAALSCTVPVQETSARSLLAKLGEPAVDLFRADLASPQFAPRVPEVGDPVQAGDVECITPERDHEPIALGSQVALLGDLGCGNHDECDLLGPKAVKPDPKRFSGVIDGLYCRAARWLRKPVSLPLSVLYLCQVWLEPPGQHQELAGFMELRVSFPGSEEAPLAP